MFSCSNQPRGCRGRCDLAGGRCRECTMYNFKHSSPSSAVNYKSKLSQPVNTKSSNTPSILESMWAQSQDPMVERADR